MPSGKYNLMIQSRDTIRNVDQGAYRQLTHFDINILIFIIFVINLLKLFFIKMVYFNIFLNMIKENDKNIDKL